MGAGNILLIKGNACITSKEFHDTNPGDRIKLMYLDMDLAEPTFNGSYKFMGKYSNRWKNYC